MTTAAPAPAPNSAPPALPPATPPPAAPPANPPAPAPNAPPAPGTPPSDPPKPGEPPAAVVPEKYEFKMPDGMKLDEALANEFTPVAKELKLTQEGAQKLADLHAKTLSKAHADAIKAHTDQVASWETAVKADPEVGGANFDVNIKTAQKTIARFGDKDGKLKAYLDQTGLGSHPEFVKLCFRIGKSISEDAPGGQGAGSGNATLSPEEKFYGKTKSN